MLTLNIDHLETGWVVLVSQYTVSHYQDYHYDYYCYGGYEPGYCEAR